jgi:signal transduction histidine kinase/DNA-binding NarL/FixJ family response regulator/HPt (histidine-containing phosphotransfer) domain-containing protein
MAAGISLRTQFLFIPIVSIIGFLLFSAYSYHLAKSNQQRLHQIEAIHVPILEKANANTIRLEQIEGILNSAVSVGDEFLALEVEPIWDSFVASYHAVGVAQSDQIESIVQTCKAWLDIALPLSVHVIENSHRADQPEFMAGVIAQRERANSLLNQCRVLSSQFHQQTQKQLSQASAEVTQQAGQGVVYSVVVGTLISLISLIVGILIVRRVLHAFSEIDRSLKEVNFDQGAAGAHVQCHSRDEIGDLAIKFNTFIDQLEENFEKNAQEQAREKAKTEFMANISHEIRTPLNAIMGFSHYGYQNPQANPQAFFGNIHEAASALLSIVNDLLDVSQLESDGLDLVNIAFDPYLLVQDLHEQHAHSARQKGIHLLFTCHTALPACVEGDPARLKQIWTNLLENSVKFTDQGAVEFELSATEKKGVIEFAFRVKDSGRGIDPSQHTALFCPFTLGDASMTRAYGGTGLGLYIARKLAQKMSGDVWLKSTGPSGSEFGGVIVLPLADSAQKGAAVSAVAIPGDRGVCDLSLDECKRRLKGTHWLLAEDNRTNQIIAQLLIEDAGATLDIGNDGEEAFELLLTHRYCGLLTDIQMPRLDGFGLTRKVREREAYNALPIIAITAHAMEGYAEKCYEAGMDGYLSKPVEQMKLLSIMAKHVPLPEESSEKSSEEGIALPSDEGNSKIESISPNSEQTPSLSQGLPGLDLETALKKMGNQEKLLKTVISEFFSQFKNADQELQNFLESGHLKEAFLLLHTLKGVCGSIGAYDLEAVVIPLVEVFRQPREGEPSAATLQDVDCFVVKLKEVICSIEQFLKG